MPLIMDTENNIFMIVMCNSKVTLKKMNICSCFFLCVLVFFLRVKKSNVCQRLKTVTDGRHRSTKKQQQNKY